jgi:hypothetical protein
MVRILRICNKMKKSLLILAAIVSLMLTLNLSLPAQEGRMTNKLIYSELGGPGVLMSINFDSRFKHKERLGLGYRLGAGFDVAEFGLQRVAQTYYTIPIGLNYVFGKPDSRKTFEMGAGVTFLTRKVILFTYDNYGYHDFGKTGNVIRHFTFMYRIVPEYGGFSFRIGFTPIIGTTGDLFPMVAVSFGYTF